MKRFLPISLCVVLVTCTAAHAVKGAAHSTPVRPRRSVPLLTLRSVNPDGWFSMMVPAASADVQRMADMDGGFFTGAPIEVRFSYYAYVNTPNFLRDSRTREPLREARSPMRGARLRRIHGNQAWVTYSDEEDRKGGYRYRYDVSFFDIPVSVGDGRMFPGTISFVLATNNRLYRSQINRIIRSIRLFRKTQSN